MLEPRYHLEGIVRTRDAGMEDFEGPLDVIFLLLSKNKIEIQDVSITAILTQYLSYLEEMKRLDMEIASEFITMASHLMLIKTKMLLSEAERQEAQEELDILRQSLLERQQKEAIEQIHIAMDYLEPKNEIGCCLFTKQPEPFKRERTYQYKHVPEDLLWALDEIELRNNRQLPPATVNFRGIVGKEPYPVTKKARQLIRILIMCGAEYLKSLFKGHRSRSEIVATFIAILELCKTGSAVLEDDVTGENPNVRLIKTPDEEESYGTN